MKQYPFLKFCRSSSSCYEWIEACDPGLFTEIRKLVDAGRWEPVGGRVEESDTILTPGEVLFRQAEFGKRCFREKFGKEIRIGCRVDSFGQNAGVPKILNATGFDRYVFMRPMAQEKTMPYLFLRRGDEAARRSRCVSAGPAAPCPTGRKSRSCSTGSTSSSRRGTNIRPSPSASATTAAAFTKNS